MIRRLIFSKQLLVFLLVLTIGLITMPKESEAISIRLINRYNQEMSIAIVYYDDSYQEWIVTGWYSVYPNSSKTLNFSTATSQNSVWIHAHTADYSWADEDYDSKQYTVVAESFQYVAGEAAPDGSNRRNVGFNRRYVNNYGIVDFYP